LRSYVNVLLVVYSVFTRTDGQTDRQTHWHCRCDQHNRLPVSAV